MSGVKIINSSFERPKPTGKWRFEWDWRNTRQKTEVTAGYAADTPPYYETRGDAVDLVVPNNITVLSEPGGTTLRFTREGAEQLADALRLALEWDGQ